MWHNTYTVSFLSHIAGDRQLIRFEGLTGAAPGNHIERGFSRTTLRGIFKGEQRSKRLHSWDAFAVLLNNFFKEFIYLFGERGREGERERNINVWLPLPWTPLGAWATTQACALTGNRTLCHFRLQPTLNPLSDTRKGIYSFYGDLI